jgi:hypothetical protein
LIVAVCKTLLGETGEVGEVGELGPGGVIGPGPALVEPLPPHAANSVETRSTDAIDRCFMSTRLPGRDEVVLKFPGGDFHRLFTDSRENDEKVLMEHFKIGERRAG